ncbi:MAG TPA: MFS transporter [Thermodesulfobacteriota bacterium]|nr:MFS transporter [Thermodesulfobacteriota bacterium]
MSPAINKRTALAVTAAASFLTPFAATSVNIALPSIGREMRMDAVLLSWVPTAYLLAAAMFLVPFGRIADLHGRKKIFTYGMCVYTAAALLSAAAQSAFSLIVFRALQGFGASMIFGTSIAIVTSIFDPGERGRALGINVATVYIGQSVGPFLGGVITEHLGWRFIFLLMFPLGIFIIIAVHTALKQEWAGAKGERFDWPGFLFYSPSLVAVIYGFSHLPSMTGGLLIAAGTFGLLVFTLWELRQENPILNMNLFRGNRVFALSNIAALINYSATFGVSFLLSLFLQYIKGFTPVHAGSLLVFQPAVQAVVSPFAGRLSDRTEPQVVASIGMAFTAAGLLLLVFLGEGTGLYYVVAALILLGFGMALFSSPNTNAIMSSVDKKSYGVASGITASMRVIGQTLSMGIATVIFAVYIGGVEIGSASPPVFIWTVRLAFGVFTALCVAGIFASLTRGKLR